MSMRRLRTMERLIELERSLETVNGQLREVPWELPQAKSPSLRERLWKNLRGARSGFMSDVCNRRVRPNTKVQHVGTSAAH
ncbi:MAG TPA: hypothetical protein VFS39_19070 [Nitrospira sp.]|nr:hypothetical protein [Nitrospira sp.]